MRGTSWHEDTAFRAQLCGFLHGLGITSNYKGYAYTISAVLFCIQQPEWLQLATKRLYPAVAALHHTSWKRVERNIRTVVSAAWRNNPALLSRLAGFRLAAKPRPTQFLAILADNLILTAAHHDDEQK